MLAPRLLLAIGLILFLSFAASATERQPREEFKVLKDAVASDDRAFLAVLDLASGR